MFVVWLWLMVVWLAWFCCYGLIGYLWICEFWVGLGGVWCLGGCFVLCFGFRFALVAWCVWLLVLVDLVWIWVGVWCVLNWLL